MFRSSVAQPASPGFTGQPKAMLNLSAFQNAVLLAVTIAALLQLAIFYDTENLIATAMVLCGAFVGLRYSVNRELLLQYPLSTLSILGYTIYYFVIPPIGKLSDFQSINHRLHHPILVWTYGLSGLVIVMTAHYAYRRLQALWVLRRLLTDRFYRPLRFFEMPTDLQLWFLGAIGAASTFIVVRLTHGGQTSTLAAFMRPLVPLIYTPYFTAYPQLLDPRFRARRQRIRLSLVLYSIGLVAIAAMTNRRAFLLMGFASVAVAYGYRVMTGTVAPPKFTLRSFIALVICLWLITGPLTNLAASMLIVRGSRAKASPVELVKTTWKAYQSGIAVKAYEAVSHPKMRARYDETYYNNLFLNRIGNVRFIDLSIDAAEGVMALGDAPYFRASELDRVLVILPSPIIRALHLDIDKDAFANSSEDFLYHMSTLRPVGSYLTGAPFVILRMTFGSLWPLWVGVLAAILFGFLDAGSDTLQFSGTKDKRIFDCVTFNPVVAGTLFTPACFFTSFGAQNLVGYIDVMTRNWIQVGLMYAAAFILTGATSSLLLGWVWRKPDAGGRAISNLGRL